jgi:hypothetical protein
MRAIKVAAPARNWLRQPAMTTTVEQAFRIGRGEVMAREAALPVQHPVDRLVGHTPAIQALPLARLHKLLTAIEAKRIRRLRREKAIGWPSPQYEGSALFSPQGKTSLRNTVIKPFQSKAVAGSTSPVARWV